MRYVLLLLLCCCLLTACPPSPNTEPVVESQTTQDAQTVKTGDIVGNVNTKKYHVGPCYYIPLIKETKRFTSTAEAKASGYTCDSASNGCKSCGK